MFRAKVYTTSNCGYCSAAKSLLQRRGVTFEEVDVTGDLELRQWLVRTTAQRTVPQIFLDGRSIGGYQELAALDRMGKLASFGDVSGSVAPGAS